MKNKIVLSIFIVLQAIFIFTSEKALAYADTPASIGLANDATDDGVDYISAKQNDTVYANVLVFQGKDGTQLCNFDINMSYDSAKLSLSQITEYAEDFDNRVSNTSIDGRISYSARSIGGICLTLTGPKKVFTAVFKVIGNGGEYAPVSISSMDWNGDSPVHLIKDGLVEIKNQINELPEIPPSSNSNGNYSNGGSRPLIPGTSISAPTPQNGTVRNTNSILPETGINLSDSLKTPELKSAYFASDYGERSKSCSGLVLSGIAEPSSKVHLIVDKTKLEYTADANPSGDWSININDYIDAGNYDITMYSALRDLISNSSTGQFVFKMPCKNHVAVGKTLSIGFTEKISSVIHSKIFSVVVYLLVVLGILAGTYLLARKRKLIK